MGVVWGVCVCVCVGVVCCVDWVRRIRTFRSRVRIMNKSSPRVFMCVCLCARACVRVCVCVRVRVVCVCNMLKAFLNASVETPVIPLQCP